jgi:hypothetical protein
VAVTSSGKIQVDINFKGKDGTGKASKSAAKNVNSVKKGAKAAAKEMLGLGQGGERNFLGLGKGAVAASAKIAFLNAGLNAIRSTLFAVSTMMGETATTVAQLEYTFGSLDEGLKRVAATGHSIGLKAFAQMAAQAKVAGVQFSLTAEQIATVGNMAKVMGQDSDEMFQAITKAIAEGEPTMLKQFGIMVDSTKAFEKYAQQQGITTAQMGITDKQAASLNAVMEVLNKTAIEGGAAFDKFDQANRAAGTGFEMLKVKYLTPLIDSLSDNLVFLLEEAGVKGKNTGLEMEDGFMVASRAATNLLTDIENVGGKLNDVTKKTKELGVKIVLEDPDVGQSTKDALKQEEKIREIKEDQLKVFNELKSLREKRVKLVGEIARMEGLASGHISFHKNLKKEVIRLGQIEEKQLFSIIKNYGKWSQEDAALLLGREKGAEISKKEMQGLAERFKFLRHFAVFQNNAVKPEIMMASRLWAEDQVKFQKALGTALAHSKAEIMAGNRQLEEAKSRQGEIAIAEEKIAAKRKQRVKLIEYQAVLAKKLFINESAINKVLGDSAAKIRSMEGQRLALLQREDVTLTGITDKNQAIFNIKKRTFEMERKAAIAKLREDEARLKRENKELAGLMFKAQARYQAITGKSAVTGTKISGGQLEQFKLFKKVGAMNPEMEARKAGLEAEAKAAKMASKKYREALDAQNEALKLSKQQIKLWEGAEFTGKPKRGRGRGGKRQEDLSLPEVERLDRQGLLLELKGQQLGLSKAITDEEKKAAIEARFALDTEREKKRLKDAEAQLDKTLAEAQKAVDAQKRLSAKEKAAIEKFNADLANRQMDEEFAHEQRMSALRGKRAAAIAELDKAISKRFAADLEKIQQELIGESALEAARRVHIEQLERIADLRSRGLEAQKAETLEIEAQAKVREQAFEAFAANTDGAIQMALNMDSIVQKYSDIANASKNAGEVGLTSGQQFVKSTAMFMQAVNAHGKEISQVVTNFKEAMSENGKGYQKAVGSMLAVGGKLAASVVEDEKTKAAILGASELAASFAAYPDVVGMTTHGIASALYFAIAGGAGKGKAAIASETEPPQVSAQGATEETVGAGTTIININAPVVSGTGAETGAMLGEWLEGAKGAGFGM